MGILSRSYIKWYVGRFLDYAQANPDKTFYVTRIGCGLAGYKDGAIAPLFEKAPDNCQFDIHWKPFLGNRFTYFTNEL